MNDSEIIELYFRRDESAIRETSEKYGRYCTNISMNILDDKSDAEECVNDTYLKTWESIPPNRPEVFRLYLAQIVRRLSISKYRSRHRAKRDKNLETAFEELEECTAVKDEDRGELTELLNGFLRTLDDDERRIFIRRYWYTMTPAEIARDEHIRTGTLCTRICRTREKLKKYLSERGYSI